MTTSNQLPILAALSAACLIAALSLISCVSHPGSAVPSREVQASHTRDVGLVPDLGRGVPKIVQRLIPAGNLNRRSPVKMKPRFITIHSTANLDETADADAHVRLLHRAGRGRLSWHYTVDQNAIFQTLPNDEQGQHADYDGPGNRYSIGIEMCENKGNSREKTLDNTARLAAQLMYQYDIPISRVVPHYHWPRVKPDGKNMGHKNCPQILMDGGKPGAKWRSFVQQVELYSRR